MATSMITKIKRNLKVLSMGLLIVGIEAGCDKTQRSFSILQAVSSYKQSTVYVPRKIDVLWVVDNSGSMATSQSNLTTNFQSFMTRFQNLNYDFHIGVTTTEAYIATFLNRESYSHLKDGVGTNHSGVFVLDNQTPNLVSTFVTNAMQGTSGSGDERAFSSFQAALNDTQNSAFRRSDAYLAIIIISDEDDFSTSTINYINNDYSSPLLYPVSNFVTWLDQFTNSVIASDGSGRNYSVSSIAIYDQTCLAQLNSQFIGRSIGQRYGQLADLTGGVKASLCADFGTSLQLISNTILELSSVFKLDRTPILGTIAISTDGTTILEDSKNGWTYDSAQNAIQFHGSAIPPAGADVRINFDPQTIIQ